MAGARLRRAFRSYPRHRNSPDVPRPRFGPTLPDDPQTHRSRPRCGPCSHEVEIAADTVKASGHRISETFSEVCFSTGYETNYPIAGSSSHTDAPGRWPE